MAKLKFKVGDDVMEVQPSREIIRYPHRAMWSSAIAHCTNDRLTLAATYHYLPVNRHADHINVMLLEQPLSASVAQ